MLEIMALRHGFSVNVLCLQTVLETWMVRTSFPVASGFDPIESWNQAWLVVHTVKLAKRPPYDFFENWNGICEPADRYLWWTRICSICEMTEAVAYF